MRSKITALVAAVAAAASAAGAAKWVRGRRAEDEARPTVTAAKPPVSEDRADHAAPDAVPGPAPVATTSPSDTLDDLTAIRGLGKVKAAKLVASGITSYAQIAAWTEAEVAWVDGALEGFNGRVSRDDWIVIENAVPPIVDRLTWARAQACTAGASSRKVRMPSCMAAVRSRSTLPWLGVRSRSALLITSSSKTPCRPR